MRSHPGVGQLYAGRLAASAALRHRHARDPGRHPGRRAAGAGNAFAGIVAFAVAAVTVALGVYLYGIVDAVLLARSRGGAVYRWYVNVAAVAAAYLVSEVVLLAVPGIRAYQPWRTFDVASASMEPTLRLGEIFIVDTTYFDANVPSHGDVVVYRLPRDPETMYIKRIVALAGERIALRGGRAFINGAAAREPYAKFGDPGAPSNTFAEFTVPANTVVQCRRAPTANQTSTDGRDLAAPRRWCRSRISRAARPEILMTSLPDRAGIWIGAPR